MPKMKPTYVYATLLYCGALFVLSSQSNPPQAPWGLLELPGFDKAIHAVLYAGLAGLVSLGIRRSGTQASAGMQFWVPLIFATLYGLSDEIHQLFVPLRVFDLLDLLADATGATIMQVILCGYLWSTTAAQDAPKTD